MPLHDAGRAKPAASWTVSPRLSTPSPAPVEKILASTPKAVAVGEKDRPAGAEQSAVAVEPVEKSAPAPQVRDERGEVTCHNRMAPEDFDAVAVPKEMQNAECKMQTVSPVGGEAASQIEAQRSLCRQAETEQSELCEDEPWRVAGEVLNTYIIVEQGEKVLFIDKHAAHERMNFDRMKAQGYQPMVQTLLTPVTLRPAAEELEVLLQNLPLLEEFGFGAEDFGGGALIVRQAPFDVDVGDIESTLLEIAGKLLTTGRADPAAARDEMLHTMACKAAIKGGWKTSPQELERVAQAVMKGEVKYCPHGRPVAIELTKKQLEKQFKRA